MTWENYLFAGALIALGLLFAAMMLLEYFTREQARESHRKYWLIPLACILLQARAQAGQTVSDSFSAKETELVSFEDKTQVILTLEKPAYRLGEIMKCGDQYVIPIAAHFDGKTWWYKVVPVKVTEKVK